MEPKLSKPDLRPPAWLAALILLLATVGLAVARHAPAKGTPAPAAPQRLEARSEGPVRFSGLLDRGAVLASGDGLVRMELLLRADADPTQPAARRPTDLVMVLDRSGSMAGLKLERARAAVRSLASSLGPDDRFALVTYARSAETTIPLAFPRDAQGRDRVGPWHETLAQLRARGGTQLSAGLDLALDEVEAHRDADRMARVVLVSDGLANQGDTSPEGLRARARRAAHGEYALSTVGVGDDFDEHLLTTLADEGTGNYYYLRHSEGLADVFAGEFEAARETIARAVSVRVRPANGVQVVDVGGYPLISAPDGSVSFRPGGLFAGQERRIWVTLRVPTAPSESIELGHFSIAYRSGGERFEAHLPGRPRVACVVEADRFHAAIDPDAWGRAISVEAVNALRQGVARAVRDGDRAAALEEVAAFRLEAASINRSLGLPSVANQLDAARELEAEVQDAFAGTESERAYKRNRLSKESLAAGVAGRRVGSKKED